MHRHNNRIRRRSLAASALAAALGLATCNAWAAVDRWQQLPPTPALPADTNGQIASIRGARIWYAQWNEQSAGVPAAGVPATGTPVLLLHGGFGSSNYYGNLIPFLVEKGYRVIAMDSRGHGRSTRAKAPITYDAMMEDVVALLNLLKVPRVSLVGWSDGGIVGLDLAIHDPKRLARLFAFGANSEASGVIDGGDKTPVFAAYLSRTQTEYQTLSPTPEQWPSFKDTMETMWNTLPAFTSGELRSIRVPTTIADGEHDEVIKAEHTRYLAATIPGAHLVFLPNVSHFAMLQDPAQFDAVVLRFLEH